GWLRRAAGGAAPAERTPAVCNPHVDALGDPEPPGNAERDRPERAAGQPPQHLAARRRAPVHRTPLVDEMDALDAVGPRHAGKARLELRRLVGHHLEASATVPAPHALDPAPAEAAVPVVDQRGPRRAHVTDPRPGSSASGAACASSPG